MSSHQQPAISRRRALTHLGLIGMASAVPGGAATAGSSDHTQLALSTADIEAWLRQASVPSCTIAQVSGDQITTRAVGVKQAGGTEPTTPDTVYAAASLTKAVFSYVVIDLVLEGVLDLDRPTRDYLALPTPDDPRAGAITARRLLSHSGGWRNWRFDTTQPFLSTFDPGTRWSYSGEGFFYLARVVESLTGKGFGQLARERVFTPLGMQRSSMLLLPEFEPFLALPHSGRGETTPPTGRAAWQELRALMASRGVPLDHARASDAEQAFRAANPTATPLPVNLNPNAAASLMTTASDFALFLRHVVTAKRRGGRAAQVVTHLMTPQIRCNEAVEWGLGVGLEQIGSRRMAWQWGDNPGYKNVFFADPDREEAIVVFTNGDRGARVYERIVRALTGMDHPAFLWV